MIVSFLSLAVIILVHPVRPQLCIHAYISRSSTYTEEPLYRGHHWDPAGCPVYSGTSLQRTPLAPSWLSCIQRSLSIEDTTGTQLAVLYIDVSLIQRQICTQLYVVGTADSVLHQRGILHSKCPLQRNSTAHRQHALYSFQVIGTLLTSGTAICLYSDIDRFHCIHACISRSNMYVHTYICAQTLLQLSIEPMSVNLTPKKKPLAGLGVL